MTVAKCARRPTYLDYFCLVPRFHVSGVPGAEFRSPAKKTSCETCHKVLHKRFEELAKPAAGKPGLTQYFIDSGTSMIQVGELRTPGISKYSMNPCVSLIHISSDRSRNSPSRALGAAFPVCFLCIHPQRLPPKIPRSARRVRVLY